MTEFDSPQVSNDELLAKPDELFPQAPDSVRAAFELYWQSLGTTLEEMRADEIRMTGVNTLLGDFGRSDLHPYAYNAAMLGKIYDGTESWLTSRDALLAMKQYVAHSTGNHAETTYVLGLLGNRRVTNHYWETRLKLLHGHDATMLPILLDRSNLLPVSEKLWSNTLVLANTPFENAVSYLTSLDPYTANVDAEAILIDSVETLAWLGSDEAKNDTRTYQQVHKAEVLLAPVCTLFGFTGLASYLRSEALVIRLINAGKPEAVDKARAYLASLGTDEQIEAEVQQIIETLLGEHMTEPVLENESQHGILMGEGTCTHERLQIDWRRKALGALANKWSETGLSDESKPMDILAATVVVESEDQIAGLIAQIVDRVRSDERMELTPTVSRVHALHIRGNTEYIEAIVQALGQENIDAARRIADIKETTVNGFHVAKLTFIYSGYGTIPLPTEIMVSTARDRREAKVGPANHVLYKLGVKIPDGYDTSRLAELTNALSNIKSRRKWLSTPKLTAESLRRSIEMQSLIDAFPWNPPE